MPNDQREPMWRRYRRLLRSDIAADVDEELQFHLEMRSRDYEARGLSSEDAHRAAREQFGDVTRVAGWLRRHDHQRERARRAREIMSSVGQNLRVGMRAFLKQPTFTAAVVLTLVLGIGATTAMFSVVYGVLLRPLPFGDPDRLVRVWTAYKPALGRGAVAASNWRDWRAQNHVFEDITIIQGNRSFNFAGKGEPERLRGADVSASFFPVLHVSPLLGRTFTEAENEIGNENVVVLSHQLWVRLFGADPSIFGRTIPLNGIATTVIGVMGPDFRYPSREIELWAPVTVSAQEYGSRTWGSYSAVARLKPGVTLQQVYWNYPQRPYERLALVVKTRVDPEVLTQSIAAVVREIDTAQPIYDTRTLDAVIDRSLGDRWFQMMLLGVFAAIALLLASIGAYGVIAYGVGQRLRVFGVRIALGARRRDVTLIVLRRGGTLFVVGAIVGLALAAATVRVLSTLVYGVAPRDTLSFVIATVVMFVVSMAACYVPARRAALVEPSIALRSD